MLGMYCLSVLYQSIARVIVIGRNDSCKTINQQQWFTHLQQLTEMQLLPFVITSQGGAARLLRIAAKPAIGLLGIAA